MEIGCRKTDKGISFRAMVTREQIEERLRPRLNNILLVAESALPERQFKAFRKLMLDCFGKSGFGKDLDELFSMDSRKGMGRAGIDCAKEGVHHG
jgi:hypothetical protein